MKKSYSILLAALLAVAVLAPVYAAADDNVPAPTVQPKGIEGPDVQ
jgi:hypothetical protein